MKNVLAVALIAVAALGGSGCYKTQEGGYRAGVPFSKDTIESRYERPVAQVFQAAKATLAYNGALIGEVAATKAEGSAQTLTGRVNGRSLWISVDEVEPRITRVLVQARRTGGLGDVDLAAEIDKQIALRLR
ncbi:MAG: DUF3568 family protein [Verrucomicrobiota bacterium]|jgi:hypothetical protein